MGRLVTRAMVSQGLQSPVRARQFWSQYALAGLSGANDAARPTARAATAIFLRKGGSFCEGVGYVTQFVTASGVPSLSWRYLATPSTVVQGLQWPVTQVYGVTQTADAGCAGSTTAAVATASARAARRRGAEPDAVGKRRSFEGERNRGVAGRVGQTARPA